MTCSLFQVDAFAEKPFTGNPAAVVPLDNWIDDALMQQLAQENNLSETVFFVLSGDSFELRWFTPQSEVDLCGHATLATAHVMCSELNHPKDQSITFKTKRGELIVRSMDDFLEMDFPLTPMQKLSIPDNAEEVLGEMPIEAYGGADLMLVFSSFDQIKNMRPDFFGLKLWPYRGGGLPPQMLNLTLSVVSLDRRLVFWKILSPVRHIQPWFPIGCQNFQKPLLEQNNGRREAGFWSSIWLEIGLKFEEKRSPIFVEHSNYNLA